MSFLRKILNSFFGHQEISSKGKVEKVDTQKSKQSTTKTRKSEGLNSDKGKSDKQLPAKYGIDEMNFAYLTVGLVSDKTVYHSITREWEVTQKNGEVLVQRLTIEPAVDTGVPTAFDTKAWVALQQIAYEYDRSFKAEWIPFSLYQVCKIMRIPPDRKNRKRVRLALRRLTRTTYIPDGSFWDNGSKGWRPVVMDLHLISDFWLATDEDKPPPDLEPDEGVAGYFSLGSIVKYSLHKRYTKLLNLDDYFSFKSSTAAELYRFLNKQMGKRLDYKIDIMHLPAHTGLSDKYTQPWQVWIEIKPAAEELKEKGFLKKYDKEPDFWRGKKRQVALFWRHPRSKNESQKPEPT